jgi:hypothetical protein
MKNHFLFVILSILFISCGGDTAKTMTVMGHVKGLKKGVLYLQYIPDSTLVTIDSMAVQGDGSFLFKTEVEDPEIYYLYLNKNDHNDINDRITFFGEPGVITINTSWQTFDTNAKVEGSKTQEKLEEYQKIMSRFNARNLELMNAAMNSNNGLDSLQRDSIQRLLDKNVQRGYAFALNFALSNTDSNIAPYIALHEVSDANIKYLDSIYSTLSPAIVGSKYGRELKKYLEEQKQTDPQ